jgi:alkylresorcinol/alkylpyrone synthase
VLQAIEGALELDPAATRRSWKLLEEVGNLSSSSVLFLLGELERDGAPKEGALGLLFAMGPGFSSELVLLRW